MVLHIDAVPADAGKRLDHVLQERLPEHSRARLQDWIKAGRVRVDGQTAKASRTMRGGERVEVEPAPLPPLKAFAEDLPVSVLYEDASVIAVDKPAGMVVHAGAGNHSGTLVNALLGRFPELSRSGSEERPGIVHRLDKETSGVILVARTEAAHRALAAQFAGREVEKVYVALVEGEIGQDSGRIDKPIERDPIRRTRMTCRTGRGRRALTEFKVVGRAPGWTLVRVRIHTGRTHQIRVHMASIGHPVAGDRIYGAKPAPEGRFFLHAQRIGFRSPAGGERVTVESPLPAELDTWRRRLGIE